MSPQDQSPDRGIGRRAFLAQSATGAALLLAVQAPVQPAASAEEPMKKADRLRKKLLECLGGPWPEPCDLKPKVRETIPKDGYRIESVTYEAEPNDRIPAYVLIPDGVDAQHPAPAVAVWHQHNGAWHLGKVEPAGLAGSPMHHTGVALAKLGYVVICPDALCFGERQDKHLRGGDFERFEFLRYVVAGRCMAWKNILDMRRAIDYLCSRPEVRKDRIGCYGHSMGSTHTWLVGPWEPRLVCLVGNCCLPTYAAIHRTHLLHCFPNFIPGWLQYGDTPDIAGLIAPRALHLNLGETDGGSPILEVREGVRTIAQAYAAAGAADKFTHYIEEGTGHVLSPEMWKRACHWFEKHLRA
jgi:dienelactone hydrolase